MDESSLTKSNDTHLTSKVIEDMNDGNKQSKKPNLNNNIIIAISLNLEDIINENIIYEDEIIQDIFYLSIIPNISLCEYIKRIFINTNMCISTLINAIIYIDIFCERKRYILCFKNIYLIVLTSCLLSLKFNEDKYIDSKFYAKIGGINQKKLNDLEYSFYLNLHFSLFVNDDLYNNYFNYFSNYLIPSKEKDAKEV